ncbi:MAG: hypothetical protein JSV49_02150 [Thermoplasmata archaeon]|nr:MAG: hypothetical protein JSV49_02150 [Thermoplasmata archaeon]
MNRTLWGMLCIAILMLIIVIPPAASELPERCSRATVVEPLEIQMEVEDTTLTLKIHTEYEPGECYVEFPISIIPVTDDTDYIDVIVNLDNPTGLKADIYLSGAIVTGKSITLTPNEYRKVTVKVFAEDYDTAGNYSITFQVKDEWGYNLLNSTVLTTVVEQYYDIELVKLTSMTYSRIVDPNAMTGDIQTEVFEVKLHNYGNGPDTVDVDWVENRNSPEPIPLAWEDSLMEIYDKYGGSDPIDEITVPAYDKIAGMPGEASLVININIPREEFEGVFLIDLVAESSAPRTYINELQREDFEYEYNTSFAITIVMPEVSIDYDESMLRKDGIKIHYGDSLYEEDKIEFYIVIDNYGSGPATDAKIKFSASRDMIEMESFEGTITIAAGETAVVTWFYTPIEEGYYTFIAEIDPDEELLGDSPHDNSWSRFEEIKKVSIQTRKPQIDITSDDDKEYDIGDIVIIRGEWDNADVDELRMRVRITYPDGTKSEFIFLTDKDSAEDSDTPMYIDIKSDGTWKFTYETQKDVEVNDGGEYTFTFKAETDDGYESDNERIDVIIGTEKTDDDEKVTAEKEEELPASMGLFSYDILVIVLIVIIFAFIAFMIIMSKKKSHPEEAPPDVTAYPPTPPPTPPQPTQYEPPPPQPVQYGYGPPPRPPDQYY